MENGEQKVVKKDPVARWLEQARWHKERLEYLQRKLSGWDVPGPANSFMASAVSGFIAAAGEVQAAVDGGWKPAEKQAKKNGPAKVEVGSVVRLKADAKIRREYDGLLEAEEMEDLKVTALHGRKVAVRSKQGTKFFPNVSHVEVQQ